VDRSYTYTTLQDRYIAIQNAKMIFNTAKDLGDEIEIKKDGFIQKRAETVLNEAIEFLKHVKK
jgi:beta-lysine 5,6-aminomutase alpha subunit